VAGGAGNLAPATVYHSQPDRLRAPLLPGPGRVAPPPFWKPGVLETLAADAGLTPESGFDLSWAYEFSDEPALLRSMLSSAPAVLAARTSGELAVRAAILQAMATHRTPRGGYRIQNEWQSGTT